MILSIILTVFSVLPIVQVSTISGNHMLTRVVRKTKIWHFYVFRKSYLIQILSKILNVGFCLNIFAFCRSTSRTQVCFRLAWCPSTLCTWPGLPWPTTPTPTARWTWPPRCSAPLTRPLLPPLQERLKLPAWTPRVFWVWLSGSPVSSTHPSGKKLTASTALA